MPKISVIIPIYNVEKYLRRCLESIKNQTLTDWEAICVNDGSPDNSKQIVEEFVKLDSRFKLVNKENGGLSDARNVGMQNATGDYILYVDSDDFIHPQTMEITYSLAMRDNSDMVSFVFDKVYRSRLMVRNKLGLGTNNVVPKRLSKKYDLEKIKTRVTDDVFQYATERTHNKFNRNRRWLIKHCQVCKNLYKRELIEGIVFIKGILFEDFPWWSEVLLRNPRVTIAPLPLYFYIPNFGGIVLGSKPLRIMKDLCFGVRESYLLYKKYSSDYQMECWNKNFKWFFVKWAFRKLKYISSDEHLEDARKAFIELDKLGVLENPVCKWNVQLKNNINKFIGK